MFFQIFFVKFFISLGMMHLALSILAQHSAPTSLHDAATDCVTSLLARLEREASLGTYYSTF